VNNLSNQKNHATPQRYFLWCLWTCLYIPARAGLRVFPWWYNTSYRFALCILGFKYKLFTMFFVCFASFFLLKFTKKNSVKTTLFISLFSVFFKHIKSGHGMYKYYFVVNIDKFHYKKSHTYWILFGFRFVLCRQMSCSRHSLFRLYIL